MKKSKKKAAGVNLRIFLREARLEAGFSQAKVAKALGYTSSQFVSNWERGLAEPPAATLKKLADIYSISIDDMFDIVLQATVQRLTEDLRAKFEGRKK